MGARFPKTTIDSNTFGTSDVPWCPGVTEIVCSIGFIEIGQQASGVEGCITRIHLSE